MKYHNPIVEVEEEEEDDLPWDDILDILDDPTNDGKPH